MTSKPLKTALLLVPIAVLAAMTLLHAANRAQGEEWRVPIAGYDPRDPLRGQYLQFRYEWNYANAGGCAGAACALCADDPAAFNPAVTLIPLAAASACRSYIAGSVPFGTTDFHIGKHDNGLTRYFIPESDARLLETLLRSDAAGTPQFALGLSVTSRGEAYIAALYLDGIPLEQWLQVERARR